MRLQTSLLPLPYFYHNLQILNLLTCILTNCNIMAYHGHCCSCGMLVTHRHTCFTLYSSGTQFSFLVHCSCMLLNAYHLCNVYVTNRCCIASASGPKDRQTILKFRKVGTINSKHLSQYFKKHKRNCQISIQNNSHQHETLSYKFAVA